MTVVLIIMSLLLSAVIPILSREYLEKAANRTALDISAIQEASRKFYIDNNSQWPVANGIYATPVDVLKANNYLPSAWNAINPFGAAQSIPANYSYNVTSNTSSLTVCTLLPNNSNAQAIIENSLTSPYIDLNGNVCSSVPVPGGESAAGYGTPIPMSANVVYQATTNGKVYAYALNAQGEGFLTGITDSSPTPTNVLQISGGNPAAGGGIYCNIAMDVNEGNYWEITSKQQNAGNMGAVTVYWVPKL